MVVHGIESIKSQVLHLAIWQGNVPFCDDESHLIGLVFCHVIAFTFVVYKSPCNFPKLVTPDEGPSLETSGSCIPTNESLFILLALPTLAQTVQDKIIYIEYSICKF
jgi:hypothetical protein